MSKYLNRLQMELMWDAEGKPMKSRGGKQLYQLLSDFAYQSDIAGTNIIATKGFVTDLASVPRLPFVFMFLGDLAEEPAVIHDFMYSTGLFPRDVADKVLREGMKVTGMSSVKIALIYAGVRVGGSFSYKKGHVR